MPEAGGILFEIFLSRLCEKTGGGGLIHFPLFKKGFWKDEEGDPY